MTHLIHMFDDDEIFGNARVNAAGQPLHVEPDDKGDEREGAERGAAQPPA